MRLVCRDSNGKLRLEEFGQDETPKYIILSHTWSSDEVLYKDVQKSRAHTRIGLKKIELCLDKAEAVGLRYAWVDTCCINKSDVAELQFAINSMFKWYRQAQSCYVHLSDVPEKQFEDSRWFKRGWTLQELIAPKNVEFFSSEGLRLGDKASMVERIETITGVPAMVLRGSDLSSFRFDEVTRWIRLREANYKEDLAYSLLGIFGVTLIPNYGEGRDKAFDRLRREVDEGIVITERPGILAKRPWNVPYQRNRDFVDHRILTEQMHERFSVPGARIALVGLGGIGKSQLAIEHCYRTRESQRAWIFWIHASNAARYEQSVREIADMIKLPGRDDPNANIYKLFRGWLRGEVNGSWMIVLDNADDVGFLLKRNGPGPNLLEGLPVCEHGSILITTRRKHSALKLVNSNDMILVSPMDEGSALVLLEKKLGTYGNHADMAALVAALDHIPLAIAQAAAYIVQMGSRFYVQSYLDRLQESDRSKQSILGKYMVDIRRDFEASNAIIVTWQISFERIRDLRPSAADLLALMSLCDRQAIPGLLLRASEKHDSTSECFQQSRQPKFIRDGTTGDGLCSNHYSGDFNEFSDHGLVTWLDDTFDHDIAVLEAYSFISTTVDIDTFQMHRLVQLSTQKWLESEGQREKWTEQFICNLAKVFPNGRYENWNTCQMLYPQAKAAIALKLRTRSSLLHQASIMHYAGWYAHERGMLVEAEMMLERSKEVRSEYLGEAHPDTLWSMANLAATYVYQGRWSEAEKLVIKVMEARKRLLGDAHPDTLSSKAQLALIYLKQGRWSEAEELELKVLETSKMVVGEAHPFTLSSMANLAATYVHQGRWNEAEELEVKVMGFRKRLLGDTHPETLLSMGNLAVMYKNQSRLGEAEEIEVKVLEVRKKVLGEAHPSTLTSMANLAATYWDQGCWTEAEELEEKVIELRKQVLGDAHPSTLTSIANLENTYRSQGRWSEADALGMQHRRKS